MSNNMEHTLAAASQEVMDHLRNLTGLGDEIRTCEREVQEEIRCGISEILEHHFFDGEAPEDGKNAPTSMNKLAQAKARRKKLAADAANAKADAKTIAKEKAAAKAKAKADKEAAANA